MITQTCPAREIDGKGRTIEDMIAGRKYSIDYCQRECRSLQRQDGHQIGRLLARVTNYLETRSRRASHYTEYVQPEKRCDETERIWSQDRVVQGAAS
jgi:hypothetical protein